MQSCIYIISITSRLYQSCGLSFRIGNNLLCFVDIEESENIFKHIDSVCRRHLEHVFTLLHKERCTRENLFWRQEINEILLQIHLILKDLFLGAYACITEYVLDIEILINNLRQQFTYSLRRRSSYHK